MGKNGKVYIGTSGYSYSHWADGVFYPQELKQKEYLEYYSRFFQTVELNITFYRLPSENAFKGWYKRIPPDFLFSIKGSRFITHIKRLNIDQESLTYFFRRIKLLKEKARVILWQLPPSMKADAERFSRFLKLLEKYNNYNHAFEFRHESWYDEKIFKLMERRKVSPCLADWPKFSKKNSRTGSFAYIRRHGTDGELYGGCYSERQLENDSQLIESFIGHGKDVYIYFNNDREGWAVKNALRLKELCSLT